MPSTSQSRFANVKLRGFWRSSCTWRTRIALLAKEIPFEYESINILDGEAASADFEKDNPMRQVPILECIDNDTGEKIRIFQSVAIIEFIHEAFPVSGSSLYPSDIVAKARVREIAG